MYLIQTLPDLPKRGRGFDTLAINKGVYLTTTNFCCYGGGGGDASSVCGGKGGGSTRGI